jgi:hypothetical protein
MTSTTPLRSDYKVSWDASFAQHREQLHFYLDYLLECNCSDLILAAVEDAVKDRSVPDGFKQRFMVRVMVQQIIEHSHEHAELSEPQPASSAPSPVSVRRAPAMERLVYFMRDILEYSTRETSLLIGITDAHVEQLLAFARRRIDMYEGPSSIAIEKPNGGYFRWRFNELIPG